jgi:hypothetical protein
LRTTSSPATSPKILRNLAAALVFVVYSVHAQEAGRFAFASVEQARVVLGAHDEYVRATAALERSAVTRIPRPLAAEEFAAAMRDTALAWTEEEKRAFAGVLERVERFLAPMRWKSPRTILLIKASDRLMDGFPHTRANAIVLQESMLREALAQPALLDYLMSHETFHVLSRADPALREELYRLIGFRACAAVELPAALGRLRITNPDAPESRHAITVRRGEVIPFVHFPSDTIDPQTGFARQMRTSWLLVDRQKDRCTVRDERAKPEELEAVYEQVGRNTGYLIHPEEILADNFALLFRTPPKVASPEVLERIRKALLR